MLVDMFNNSDQSCLDVEFTELKQITQIDYDDVVCKMPCNEYWIESDHKKNERTYYSNDDENCTIDKLDIFDDGSCIALYQFDGNANDTGGEYNGTWEGDEAYVDGKFGKAADFSTDSDYITTDLSFSDTIKSLSFWVYMIEEHGDGTLFAQDGSDSAKNYIGFDLSDDFRISRNNKRSFACDKFDYGKYIHFIVQDDGEEISVYANGEKQTNKETDYNSINGLQISNFGHYPNNPEDHSAHCYMDQVRIFNRVLTEDEVNTLYTEGDDC